MPLPSATYPAGIVAAPGEIDTAWDNGGTYAVPGSNIPGAYLNQLAVEIRAVQTELGTDPAGSLTNVKTRLAVCLNDDGTFKGTLSSAFVTSGVISPAQLTAQTDDWAPTGLSSASVIRASTDASRDLTGLTGGSAGRVIFLHNVGAFDLVLKDESASSTAANRFALAGDVTIQADGFVVLQYDGTSTRWRAVSGGAGISGGTANFVSKFASGSTLALSAYGDDGTYGTFMGIGSSTFNDASTLMKWRGSSAPATFTHGSAGGTSIHFRAQDAFATSNGNGADFQFTVGNKDGSGTEGGFQINYPLAGNYLRFLQNASGGSDMEIRTDFTQLRFTVSGSSSVMGLSVSTWKHFGSSGAVSIGQTTRAFGVIYGRGFTADSGQPVNILEPGASSVSDANTFLRANTSAPAAYTNAADTHGKHAIFRAQSGGTHTAANPNGGDFRFILSAAGSGGGGADGWFKIYDSTVAQSFRFLFSGGDASFGLDTGELYMPIDGGDLHIQPANGTVYVYSTGGNTLNLAHNNTDGVISTSSGDLQLNPATGFVGINKSSPGFPLDVATTATNTARFYTTNDNSNGVSIHIVHDSPTPAANDKVGTFYFLADDSGGTQRVIGRIAMQFDDPTSTSMDSSMIYSTQDAVNAGDFNKNATLTSLGVWTDASAEAFKAWDGRPDRFFGKSVVAGLRELRCEVYHSSSQSPGKLVRERHISPSAEDLWRVFPGLGRDPERLKANGQTPGIAAKDLGGLAICGVVENANEIDALKARVVELEQEVERLKAA